MILGRCNSNRSCALTPSITTSTVRIARSTSVRRLRSRLRSRRCRIGSSTGHADLQGNRAGGGRGDKRLGDRKRRWRRWRRCLHGGGRLKQRTQPRMFANPSASSWKRQVVGRTNSLARSNPSFAAGSYLCTPREGRGTSARRRAASRLRRLAGCPSRSSFSGSARDCVPAGGRFARPQLLRPYGSTATFTRVS
jgi:hypothetical protein